MNPEPIWDWLSSVQFLGWYRVEGELSKFRNSVGYITAMNALQCNAMATDAIMAKHTRNATMEGTGYLNGCRYLLHDRDRKFCHEFRDTLASGGVECTPIPPRSPNLNAHAERWVRSIKAECLTKLMLFGEHSLRRVVSNFLEHYHQERNHQGK